MSMDSRAHCDTAMCTYVCHTKVFFHTLYRMADIGCHSISDCTHVYCNRACVYIWFRTNMASNMVALWCRGRSDISSRQFPSIGCNRLCGSAQRIYDCHIPMFSGRYCHRDRFLRCTEPPISEAREENSFKNANMPNRKNCNKYLLAAWT